MEHVRSSRSAPRWRGSKDRQTPRRPLGGASDFTAMTVTARRCLARARRMMTAKARKDTAQTSRLSPTARRNHRPQLFVSQRLHHRLVQRRRLQPKQRVAILLAFLGRQPENWRTARCRDLRWLASRLRSAARPRIRAADDVRVRRACRWRRATSNRPVLRRRSSRLFLPISFGLGCSRRRKLSQFRARISSCARRTTSSMR